MLSIDLNCDMGEGMTSDAAIMPFISSANIACGEHAGDEGTMRATVQMALAQGVAIGAHPSYPDRENFGRVDLLAPGARSVNGESDRQYLHLQDLAGIITRQLENLQHICGDYGARLHHVKLHGALYNRAAKDPAVGAACCEAIGQFDPSLIVYGLSGSGMQAEALRCGLRFVHEVFADRGYGEDGRLLPRNEPGALIEDPALALRQVLKMIREGRVVTATGAAIPLVTGTVCIHGDGSHPATLARLIHEELIRCGIAMQSP